MAWTYMWNFNVIGAYIANQIGKAWLIINVRHLYMYYCKQMRLPKRKKETCDSCACIYRLWQLIYKWSDDKKKSQIINGKDSYLFSFLPYFPAEDINKDVLKTLIWERKVERERERENINKLMGNETFKR